MSTSIPTDRQADGSEPTTGWRTIGWLLCAGGAPSLLALVGAFVLVAALFGFHPLWREHELNLAEAAALRDSGMIARLVKAGQNPNERLYVRPEMLISTGVRVTPLEAAVGAKRLEVVHLLLASGAKMTEADRQLLLCFAKAREAHDIVEYLADLGSGERDVDCGAVKTPW